MWGEGRRPGGPRSYTGALGVEQPLWVPPSGKSSEGRNFVAREKMRVALPAFLSPDFVHRCATLDFTHGLHMAARN